ncbi:hypothetical protein OAG24_00055 [bacterium]|nr:hypothetical protein [bacterium]
MANRVLYDQYFPSYPAQPGYTPTPSCEGDRCYVNQRYKTLPKGFPMETVAAGPSSMKHLYTGVPNYYPIQKIMKPIGSMYEADFSQYNQAGKRMSYHYKVYPFTHRHAREVREYENWEPYCNMLTDGHSPIPGSSGLLPYMSFENWTKYPVIRDSTLNNPGHTITPA